MSVDLPTVKRVACLARIAVTDEEAARIRDETLALDVLFEGDAVTTEKATSGAR